MAVPWPTVIVEAAWDDTADEPNPTWYDLGQGMAVAPIPAVSVSARGRSFEQDDVAAVTATIDVDNTDHRLTPGNAIFPNVDVDKQLRIRVTPPAPYDGTTYGIHRGFIGDINVDAKGGFEHSTARITTTDNSDGLNLVELKSDFVQELLALGPWAYWPLSEADGATMAGDLSGNGRAPLPLKSFVGFTGLPGVFKFGEDPLAPSDLATSLALTPNLSGGSTDSGFYLEVPTGPHGVTLTYATGFTLILGFLTGVSISGGMVLLEATDATGSELVQIVLEGVDQKILASFFPGTGADGDLFISGNSYNDNAGHMLVVVVENDAQTMNVYVDGALIGHALPPTAGPGTVVNGRLTFGFGTGTTSTGGAFFGRFQHPAVLAHPLTAAQVARLWQGWQGFPGETADTRVSRYLTYGSWPGGTSFDIGRTLLGVQPIGGKTILEAAKAAVASEQGTLFVDGNGASRFQNRHHRINKASVVTFGSALPIDRSGLAYSTSRQYVRNDITGTRPGGTTQRLFDQTSIDNRRRRTDSIDLAVLTDNELIDAVAWRLLRYKNPSVRVGSIVLDPFTTPALWPYALGLEMGDRITITDLPSSFPTPTMDFYVESVAYASSATSWKTTLSLSPADDWTFWQLDDPVFSVLGSTTRLAY